MFSKLRMPTKEQALPGRAEAMDVPDAHHVNGARLTPPFPAGLERAVFGMGCFWGAEKKFWQLPVSTRRRSAMQQGSRRIQPIVRSAAA